MKKIDLIKNPELFQGEKYLNINKNYFEGWYFKNTTINNGISFIPGINNINKNYFEGWYFKNTTINNGISFIPGINIEGKNKKSFIQMITNNESYFVNYDIDDFKFNYNPFYIQMTK